MRKLQLKQPDEYSLVQIEDGNEKVVASFECLPNKSLLKFKLKKVKEKDDYHSVFIGKSDERLRKKIENLEMNMDLIKSASGNDLRILTDMDTSKFEDIFHPEFLQKVKTSANDLLLIQQKNNAIMSIKNPWYLSNGAGKDHEFPTPCLAICIY